jgi:hypothetical protein
MHYYEPDINFSNGSIRFYPPALLQNKKVSGRYTVTIISLNSGQLYYFTPVVFNEHAVRTGKK